jgi:hypothetical protein
VRVPGTKTFPKRASCAVHAQTQPIRVRGRNRHRIKRCKRHCLVKTTRERSTSDAHHRIPQLPFHGKHRSPRGRNMLSPIDIQSLYCVALRLQSNVPPMVPALPRSEKTERSPPDNPSLNTGSRQGCQRPSVENPSAQRRLGAVAKREQGRNHAVIAQRNRSGTPERDAPRSSITDNRTLYSTEHRPRRLRTPPHITARHKVRHRRAPGSLARIIQSAVRDDTANGIRATRSPPAESADATSSGLPWGAWRSPSHFQCSPHQNVQPHRRSLR